MAGMAGEVTQNAKHEPYKREDTAIATSDCELKFLTLDNLREVCNDFPSVRVEMWLLVQLFHTSRISAQVNQWNDAEAKEGEVDPHVSVRAKEHSNKHTRAVAAAAAAAASSRWSRLARPG
jgi:hypothetical protein